LIERERKREMAREKERERERERERGRERKRERERQRACSSDQERATCRVLRSATFVDRLQKFGDMEFLIYLKTFFGVRVGFVKIGCGVGV
jgi:hypothetical protein